MRALLIAWLPAAGMMVFGFQSGNQGTIAGQVVNQATGAPLKDAIVKLRYINPSGQDETMVRQTNEAGRFALTELWGREWELSAECRGFVTGTYHATRYAPQGRFSLQQNQQIKDIVLKLASQAVVAGRVVDAGGEPVEGARVTLLQAGYSGGVRHWREVAAAETLDNGEYRIPRVAAGRYVVKSTIPAPSIERTPSESEVETSYAATYHPNVTDQSLAAPVDVTDGAEVRGVNVQLVPTSVFHVRGRLQSTAGWHNVMGRLTLVDRTDQTKVIATSKSVPPDHLFDLARIPPGSYLAYAELEATGMYVAAQAVDVASRDVEGLVLNLAQADAIPGVVKSKSDDRQAGFRKISLKIAELQIGMVPISSGVLPRVEIGDDLTFRARLAWHANFAGFRVMVSDLPDGCYVASIRYGGRDVPDSGIEYSAGAALVITIGSDGGRIDGRTAGKDDQPSGGAVVGLFSADGKSGPRSLQADAQGTFHFSGIPPGDYKLIAWDDVSRDDLENPEFVNRFDSQATAISLAASGSATASIKVASQ